jgi:hypothetical protein
VLENGTSIDVNGAVMHKTKSISNIAGIGMRIKNEYPLMTIARKESDWRTMAMAMAMVMAERYQSVRKVVLLQIELVAVVR